MQVQKEQTWSAIKAITGYTGDTSCHVLAACMSSSFSLSPHQQTVVVKCGVGSHHELACCRGGVNIKIGMGFVSRISHGDGAISQVLVCVKEI